MRIGRSAVLWLTLSWLLALVLVSDVLWFVRGGAAEVETNRVGVLVPAVAAGPDFTDAPDVLSPDTDAGAAPTTAGIEAALADLVTDPKLGTSVGVTVRDAANGQVLYTRGGNLGLAPASTTKTVTAAAVLLAYGPAHRFETRVVAGSQPGEVVLIGGGDPTLAFNEDMTYPGSSRLDTLAAAVRTKLAGTAVTRVVVDSSLFTGPTVGPGWDSDIVSGGYASPVNALTADGGRLEPTASHRTDRTPTPDLFVGHKFATMLGAPDADVVPGAAVAGAQQLGVLKSPTLIHLVETMLRESDNVIAESMLRQIAVAEHQPATFAGGIAAEKLVLSRAGVDVSGDQLVDGSGLSRQNRATAALFSGVLAAATRPDQPRLRALLAGLPVASYSGTLADRFDGSGASAGVGVVRAKTGTLTGVSSLAGVVDTHGGHELAFATIANGIASGGTEGAEAALDRIAAALAGL